MSDQTTMLWLRQLIKRHVPNRLLSWRQRLRILKEDRRCRRLSVREVFAGIYGKNRWGGQPGTFYSGPGSEESFGIPYATAVREFICSHGIRSVVDLGCGDFRVGNALLMPNVNYLGIDVVPELIAHNVLQFAGPQIDFRCLNIIEDDFPTADLGLIRQVLQHLSNDQIAKVIHRCKQFRYLLVTEHIKTTDPILPNADICYGRDTRLNRGYSGVFLDKPPFSLSCTTLLEIRLGEGEAFRTDLIEWGPTAT